MHEIMIFLVNLFIPRSVSEPPASNCVRTDPVKVKSLGKIREARIEGVLLKKTCQRLGKHPKIRRWKAYYCVVSFNDDLLYLIFIN